jgi:hypothetical protein
MITNPFRNRQLRDWLCQNVDPSALGLKTVSTTGSGPFEEAEFDEFLRRSGIRPRTITETTKVLVIGRRDWSESALRKLIQARSGQRLRVYSQEMLIAFLVTGNDPLSSPSDVVERWGRGHPALTFLSEVVGFDWPTTVVHGGGGSELQADWLQRGFLKYLGYAVGRSGGSEEERHGILRKVYTTQRLPTVFPPQYRSEWGRPRSAVRLKKMAYSIACFCQHAKRRRKDELKIAIADWEDDLGWLRVKYYDGRYQFEWPSTEVW